MINVVVGTGTLLLSISMIWFGAVSFDGNKPWYNNFISTCIVEIGILTLIADIWAASTGWKL